VAASIIGEITSGRLPPGERLPPERALGVRYGVSRTVVREAMQALASRGVVTIRPGSGVYVAHVDASVAAEALRLLLHTWPGLTYEKIYEVREVIEVRMAGLAAERATDEDLERVVEAVRELDTAPTGEAYAQADASFHLVLADLTHNEVFRILLESVGEIMLELRRQVAYEPKARHRVNVDHKRIAEAVIRRDPEAARGEMESHLGHSRDLVLSLDRTTSGRGRRARADKS
jgi:GntR family transcriptional repressor for pyruvate dehydrogenase complex